MEAHLSNYLSEKNIIFQEFKHDRVFTVSESKKIKKDFEAQGSKNLFLKSDNSKFFLVCMDQEKRLDIKSLQKHLLVPKLRFASEEELFTQLNLTPGSVSIFGLIHNSEVHLILDEALWSAKSVGFHPNSNDATLVLEHDSFSKFYHSLPNKKEILSL